jgi:hypothetical protein
MYVQFGPVKTTPNKSTTSNGLRGRKPTGRSRITNGSALLPTIDGRSIWARRLRDVIALHASDLGGSDHISEAERSLVRRAGALTVELEHLEERFLTNGEATPNQLELYGRTANTLRRLLEALGLERRAVDVTPAANDATARIIEAMKEGRYGPRHA